MAWRLTGWPSTRGRPRRGGGLDPGQLALQVGLGLGRWLGEGRRGGGWGADELLPESGGQGVEAGLEVATDLAVAQVELMGDLRGGQALAVPEGESLPAAPGRSGRRGAGRRTKEGEAVEEPAPEGVGGEGWSPGGQESGQGMPAQEERVVEVGDDLVNILAETLGLEHRASAASLPLFPGAAGRWRCLYATIPTPAAARPVSGLLAS